MSNSINTFTVKKGFFGKAVLIAETSRASIRGGARAIKFPCMTEKVASVDLYVANARKAAESKVMDLLNVGRVTVVPRMQDIRDNNGNVTNSFLAMTFFADSAEPSGEFSLKDFKKSEEQLAKISTGNGDVTEFMDFEETFGEFVLMNVVTEYFRDPVTNQVTSDIDNYAVTLRSEKTNEVYNVDVNDLTSKVKDLPVFSKVKLVEPAARLFRDNSQAENIRVSVSLSAADIVEIKESVKGKAPVQGSGNSKPTNN